MAREHTGAGMCDHSAALMPFATFALIEKPRFEGKEQVKRVVQNVITKTIVALLYRSQLPQRGKQLLKQLGKRLINSPLTPSLRITSRKPQMDFGK